MWLKYSLVVLLLQLRFYNAYQPRESLYGGPQSHMYGSSDEDRENVEPNRQYTSTPRSRMRMQPPSLLSMLQQQQNLLQSLITKQDKMEAQQTKIEKNLSEMEQTMHNYSACNTTDSDKSSKKIEI